MKRTISWILIIFFLFTIVVVISSHGIVADVEDISGDSEPENFTSMRGIQFSATWSAGTTNLTLSGENPTEQRVSSSIIVRGDGKTFFDKEVSLGPNQTWEREFDVRPHLRVVQDEHTIVASTAGGSATFNTTKAINETTVEDIPKPYISEISVENGTIDGERSAVANVTVSNPTNHTYPKKLMVHTTETDGSLYPASVRPGETRTIQVELLDNRGAEVAGEARLYTDDLDSYDGALDQVEFAGQAGEPTESWETSYEPVDPYWDDDHYQYENESVAPQDSEFEIGGEVAIVGVLVLLLVAIFRNVAR